MLTWFPIVITLELTVYFILLLCISFRLNRRHRRKSPKRLASLLVTFARFGPSYHGILHYQRTSKRAEPDAVNT